ncbi:hypothetical protein [Rubrimonas cliftonensis]|uniref:Uncharacterized protein n=1 Tax=Rubrimonas cliftonensis TaxID=89524 RepID=A0A1H4FMF6_9RHOB|nr:hypothetical protein [Rubrimonas cliftonensis]SEA98010.1 hypothetical protein SAMN05444370_12427 [Rubrimonas cliftonensis]
MRLAEAGGASGPDAISLARSPFDRSARIATAATAQARDIERMLRGRADAARPAERAFRRETPLRDGRDPRSAPVWGRGGRVVRSEGPFDGEDGRRFWFDFYAVAADLAPVHLAGEDRPALLAAVGAARADAVALPPGGVWVRADLLAEGAPADGYFGLRIAAGRLAFDATPRAEDGRLTLPPRAGFRLQVTPDYDRERPAVERRLGADLAAATLSLPERLALTVAPGGFASVETGAASWRLFGAALDFEPQPDAAAVYRDDLKALVLPLAAAAKELALRESLSPFVTLGGSARIVSAGWALPVATLDDLPVEPDGAGGLTVQGNAQVTLDWAGLQGGPIRLPSPAITLFPGLLIVSDTAASNRDARQRLRLWRDADALHRSELLLRYTDAFRLSYAVNLDGDEAVLTETDAEGRWDRPVDVRGTPFPVRTLRSLLLLHVSDAGRFAALFDDDILVDALDPAATWPVAPGEATALAIRNALFTVTPVNSVFLFAVLRDPETAERGLLLLAFGLYGALPTLPDPYAANLRWMTNDSRGAREAGRPRSLLISRTAWTSPAEDDEPGMVDFGFDFAPLAGQDAVFAQWAAAGSSAGAVPPATPGAAALAAAASGAVFANAGPAASRDADRAAAVGAGRRDIEWDRRFHRFRDEQFALVDVSSNADQMGVSFAWFDPGRLQDEDLIFYQTFRASAEAHPDGGAFPVRVQGLDLVSQGRFVRGFALPQVSWEPLVNLTPPQVAGDPPILFNFYPDDGGPTRFLTDSVDLVPIAPLPVTEFLVEDFTARDNGFSGALFTLPFGLRAFAELTRPAPGAPGAALGFNRPAYPVADVVGGLQLRADAPPHPARSATFRGGTFQLSNVVTATGAPTFASTLGGSVTGIFNRDFFGPPNPGLNNRGVPLTRIDFSGYGANTFSHWFDPNAAIAQTSQTRFDIFNGRCAHELIQVRSLVYPWGVRVVRTITIFRTSSANVFRFDTGWQAESDGLFDFRYTALNAADQPIQVASPFTVHPGLVKGLFRIRNIVETPDIPRFEQGWSKQNGDLYIDGDGRQQVVNAATDAAFRNPQAVLQPVYFDADVQVEGIVAGGEAGRTAATGVLGFVQLAPKGEPIPASLLEQLLITQGGAIGGPVDCEIDVLGSGQRMRLTRIEVGAARDAADGRVFAGVARGAVVLPQEGSWSVVEHNQGTGAVAPVGDATGVPVIRRGALVDPAQQTTDAGQADRARLANPRELIRVADATTRNYAFLQSTGTQKALFPVPSFEQGVNRLLGETPRFADAYRILNSEIFPNLEDALPLALGGFQTRIVAQGYQLIDQFDPDAVFEQVLPDGPLFLINEDFIKIYVEYARKDTAGVKQQDGSLRYGFDALAQDVADKWLSKVNDIGMVVDLGDLKRIMIIKGRFDAEKGAAPTFAGPEIEFSDALQPIIDILQILAALSGQDYAGAFAKGLEVAMSNSADSWTYAFHAKKEIPLIRFPPAAVASALDPLKLECQLALGVYFNEINVFTSDPKDLIPSAGAFIDFKGRLSVMCVSVAAATVYATGSVDLRTAADIKTGPSLLMKFGFGCELVVGLPVVGNVSLLYMVGVEMFLDTSQVTVSAFLLFRGRAEILGGIVTVTITIEARGTVQRLLTEDRTNMSAQVSFGIDISIFLVINISFHESWQEQRQIA